MKTSNLFWQCVSLVLFLCVVVLLFSDEWIVSWPAKVTAVKGDVNGSFFWSNLNFYGIVGVVLALFSLLYTFRSYVSQRQTESNTRNVPIKDQINKFRDLTRHEYRNLVVVLTTAMKFFADDNAKNGMRKAYPSESHILKLQAAPEDFVLDINPQMAATVSEMRLLLRNYNIEINVACNHLSRPAINDDAVNRDYDNLIFKPLFLVRNACNMEAQLKEEENLCWREAFKRHFHISKQPEQTKQQRVDALLVRSIKIIIKEHLKKIAINLPKVIDELSKMQKNSPEEYEQYRQLNLFEDFGNYNKEQQPDQEEKSIENHMEGTEASMGATVPDYRIENQPQSNVNIEEGVDDNGNNEENTSTNLGITGQMGFH